MHEAERRLRAMINSWSSAFTRWWCHSAARHILTGYGHGSTRALRHGREGSHATSVPERAENCGHQRSPADTRAASDLGRRRLTPCAKRPSRQPLAWRAANVLAQGLPPILVINVA